MSKNKKIKFFKKIYWLIIKQKFRGITSPLRVLPDFIIIGAMKSGTTSLYYNISQHSNIYEAAYDEIGFFDDNFDLGLLWYKSMFPSIFKKKISKFKNKEFLTGEDTPFYFWKENAVNRIQKILPNVKLILILRNPIDRAYSNYTDKINRGTETTEFDEVVKNEIAFIQNKSSKLKKNNLLSDIIIEPAYLAKGIYVKQLQLWTKKFPLEQIHILSTEKMAKDPFKTLENVFEFLEISKESIKIPELRKKKEYSPMNSETRKLLIEFFKPYNEELYKMINQRFEWDK